ncbi:hypothetical protein C4B68_16415 [Streptomyces dengpaensis]|uniref:Lipoprotein n=1 Tax=Streptomyces dengpaensis TaxID=2049881 RepID=A0ABM6T2V8_9ACTN|nr:hypothetical protein C4B68_16415 [Streptomyces dengpaensis]PIB09194.1 hypothetical protein B1C81_12095 [Streptomyces sp. HG99]
MITAIRKTVTAAGCAAVVLATAAACGTVQNLTAGQKVDHAVDRLGEQKSLSFQLDLDADSDAITELAGDSGSDDALPPEFAKFISGLRVDVSVKSKKALSDSGEKDLIGTSVKIAGADGVLVEYRVVGDFTYYRADMKAVGEAMGFPMPTPEEIPDSEKEFRKVLEGEWVKVDTSELAEATQMSEESAKGSDSADEIDAKTQQKIIKAVRGVIAHEVTFSAKGSSDGTEHVVAKGNFRDLIRGVFDKLRPLEGDLPPGTDLPSDKDLKEAPNKNVAVDFTLKNGDLTQVKIDLAVLAEDPKAAKLPLVLKFSKAGDVSAPAGATEIPVDKVPSGSPFGDGLLGGGAL